MKPELTSDVSAIRDFLLAARHGITYDTLQLLTDASSENLTFRQIISLIHKKNGSYNFVIDDEEYLMYTTFDNTMHTYIFKFGKHEEDTAKFQFIRKKSMLDNCFYMIDAKTKQVISCYDFKFNETVIFSCASLYFPPIICIPYLNNFRDQSVISISLEDSIAIGLEQEIQPYKILCELDN